MQLVHGERDQRSSSYYGDACYPMAPLHPDRHSQQLTHDCRGDDRRAAGEMAESQGADSGEDEGDVSITKAENTFDHPIGLGLGHFM